MDLAGVIAEEQDFEIVVVDLSYWCYIQPCELHALDCGVEVI